ncbi:hypothetical protein LTR87_015068 [Friedmanniomyces endolithicus]|nr:hypothetical protein LTR87_015068 [Friedmanniomyces endolithicus]
MPPSTTLAAVLFGMATGALAQSIFVYFGHFFNNTDCSLIANNGEGAGVISLYGTVNQSQPITNTNRVSPILSASLESTHYSAGCGGECPKSFRAANTYVDTLTIWVALVYFYTSAECSENVGHVELTGGGCAASSVAFMSQEVVYPPNNP